MRLPFQMEDLYVVGSEGPGESGREVELKTKRTDRLIPALVVIPYASHSLPERDLFQRRVCSMDNLHTQTVWEKMITSAMLAF